MRRGSKWVSWGALALCLGCGDINVPNLNNLPYESLLDRPSRTLILNASTGLLIGTRAYVAAPNGYVAMTGILGRESYNFDRADPRFISEMLEAPSLDPGSPAFGGNFWGQPYSNIRNANTLLKSLDAISTDPATGITGDERAAIRGYAKTIKALDFLTIANTRHATRCPAPPGQTPATNCSGPIDVDRALSDPLAPIVTKDEVLTHIRDLLDEGQADLATAAGGANSFPFEMGSGFAGFDTPATFVRVNRALQARVQVYRQQWAAAKTAVDASFIDVAKPFSLGAYHSYGDGAGDLSNGLISPNEFVHPKVKAEAEAGDTRIFGAQSKIKTVDPTTLRGLSSDLGFTLYPAGNTPVPIIRNEELILLRAEIAAQQSDLPAALVDVNLVRTTHGLPAKTAVDLDTQQKMIDEILGQRRYSLLFEGGHRWIDLRRYGKLDGALLDLPTHFVHTSYPIPVTEMDARSVP